MSFVHRIPLLLAALASAQSTVNWQQVGGSFQATPTLKVIVGQGYETPVVTTASGDTVRSGFLAHPLFLNQGPFVASPLGGQAFVVGGPALTLDLSGVFASWEGNPLDLTVAGGEGTVTASLSGSLLTLDPVAAGSGHLLVKASDGTLAAVDTLEVVVTGGAVGIATRPASLSRSTELTARIAHLFAAQADGVAAGRLGTDPTGCDDNSCLSLELALPSASVVQVSIFDQLGTPVISWSHEYDREELARIGAGPDGRYPVTVSWNLRAANGAAVAPGVYLWKVEARTAGGQRLETVKRMGVKGAKR